MIEYLLKFLASTAILYGVYLLFLQKERIYQFNRYYLLAIVILSLIIPVTIVKTDIIQIPVQEVNIETEAPVFFEQPVEFATPPSMAKVSQPFPWEKLALCAYILISSLLLFRLLKNLWQLQKMKLRAEITYLDGNKVALLSEVKSSFSFMNTIFLNREQYYNGHLPQEILKHETVHINQKHSLDIISIELLQVALWFNPMLALIKKSIKLNHEFLADAHILQGSTSLRTYQELLIKHSSGSFTNSPILSSPLNYSLTKKRLKMMAKNTNKFKALLTSTFGLAAIISTFYLLGETKVVAQMDNVFEEAPYAYSIFSELQLQNYSEMSDSAKQNSENRTPDFRKPLIQNQNFSSQKTSQINTHLVTPNTKVRFISTEGDTIQKLYKELSALERKRFLNEESKSLFFSVIEKSPGLNQKDWEVLYNEEEYGIWLNGDQIPNEELSNYQPSDIYKYSIRKLGRGNSLGDFEKQFFALTKMFVNEKYGHEDMSEKGHWANYQEFASLSRAVKKLTAKNDTLPKQIRSVMPRSNSKVRYITTQGDTIQKLYKELSPSELERFKQNEARPAYFLPPPPKGIVPEKFAKLFANEREYGIWVDGKRVPNSELENYSADDIHHFTRSKLLPNAKNYGNHKYQVDFTTNSKQLTEGVWINLLTIDKEDSSNKNWKQPQNQTSSDQLSTSLFPSHVFHDGLQIRRLDRDGNLMENESKKTPEKVQFFIAPVEAQPVTYEKLNEYITNSKFFLWVNNQPIENKEGLKISANQIHHTQEIFMKGINHINLITKDYPKIRELEDGFWVTIPKESVELLVGK